VLRRGSEELHNGVRVSTRPVRAGARP
jgi:hypothetical protein